MKGLYQSASGTIYLDFSIRLKSITGEIAEIEFPAVVMDGVQLLRVGDTATFTIPFKVSPERPPTIKEALKRIKEELE